MKKFLFFGAITMLAMLVVAGCDKTPKTPVVATELTISSVVVENSVEVSVTSSEPDQSYVIGVIKQTELDEIGGKEGLVQYINESMASSSEIQLFTGNVEYTFSGLEWFNTYYAYAAQVDGNKVYGEPVMADGVSTAKMYFEFIPEIPVSPVAISDNGKYIVGNYTENSFILNLQTGEAEYVNGAQFYDVTDDGVAYGNDLARSPIKHENGQTVSITKPLNATEASIFGITPDGSKGAGYMTDVDYMFNPIGYDNGAISQMSLSNGPDGNPAIGGAVKGMASNGVAAGYIITADYIEMSAIWKTDGTCVVIGSEFMNYVEEWAWWDVIYGNMFTVISPNGKYVAAMRAVTNPDNPFESFNYPFLYDVENNEMYDVTAEECNGINIMRVDAVSSDGIIYMSNTDLGFSTEPYVFTKDNGVERLQEYVERTYSVTLETAMEGSVLGTSLDGRTILLGNNHGTDSFKTMVYSF